ncbi:MAG: glycosyltransferase family 4 protein [Thermomicrobium sp.]|nr:glycosyltransferase family 4 protein [Thermomicrobium sp.]
MRPTTIVLDGRILAYRRGGIARYVECLARSIAECRDIDGDALECKLLTNRPLPSSPLPTIRCLTPPHHRFEVWTLAIELARRRPSLFHATDFVLPVLPRSVRGIVTIHDLAFLDAPHELAPEAYRYYVRTLSRARKADRVIADSRATAAKIVERCPELMDRVRVVHLGVDRRWFAFPPGADEILTERLGDLATRPLVLAVGTVEPRKRYDLLLDTFRLLREELGGEPFLVVVGQRGWRAEATAARLRREEAKGTLRWLEDADDAVLQALYSRSSLLVVASRDEGFCLPALEALAAGLPVVAFAVGALPEVLGDAALLVTEETPEALATACVQVLRDAHLRQQLSARGRVRAQQFSWEKTARETLRVYREVLQDGF